MSLMTCPWCGRAMTPGELESRNAITWYPSRPAQPTARHFLSWAGVRELCAPITGNIRIPHRGGWERAENRLPAGYCSDCGRFVIAGRVKEV